MYVACRGLGARGSLLVMCVAQIEVHVSLNRVERQKRSFVQAGFPPFEFSAWISSLGYPLPC